MGVGPRSKSQQGTLVTGCRSGSPGSRLGQCLGGRAMLGASGEGGNNLGPWGRDPDPDSGHGQGPGSQSGWHSSQSGPHWQVHQERTWPGQVPEGRAPSTSTPPQLGNRTLLAAPGSSRCRLSGSPSPTEPAKRSRRQWEGAVSGRLPPLTRAGKGNHLQPRVGGPRA